MMWDSVEISDIVEGFFIPFVAVFGILGNVASICVLRDNRLEMKATFRYLITVWTYRHCSKCQCLHDFCTAKNHLQCNCSYEYDFRTAKPETNLLRP